MAKASVKSSSKLQVLSGAKSAAKIPLLGKTSKRAPSPLGKDYAKKKKAEDGFGSISFGQTGLTGQS